MCRSNIARPGMFMFMSYGFWGLDELLLHTLPSHSLYHLVLAQDNCSLQSLLSGSISPCQAVSVHEQGPQWAL
jgi:hypothetical protein